jgi:hypothetical protein
MRLNIDVNNPNAITAFTLRPASASRPRSQYPSLTLPGRSLRSKSLSKKDTIGNPIPPTLGPFANVNCLDLHRSKYGVAFRTFPGIHGRFPFLFVAGAQSLAHRLRRRVSGGRPGLSEGVQTVLVGLSDISLMIGQSLAFGALDRFVRALPVFHA